MNKENIEVSYCIYLPYTDEYIKQTVCDNVWCKTTNVKDIYYEHSLFKAIDLIEFIANEKFLEVNKGIILLMKIEHTMLERIDV